MYNEYMNQDWLDGLRQKDGALAQEAQSLERQIHPLMQRLNQVQQARMGIQAILIAEGFPPQNYANPTGISGMPGGGMVVGDSVPLTAMLTATLLDGIPRSSAELAAIAEQSGYQFENKSGARVVHTTMVGVSRKGSQFIKDGDKWRLAPPPLQK